MDKRLATELFYYHDGKLYNKVSRGSRALKYSEAGGVACIIIMSELTGEVGNG